MRRIAIITPGVLPVPAVSGGAVERLITVLIEQNEIHGEVYFDVYTKKSEKLRKLKYSFTRVIQVRAERNNHIVARVIHKLKYIVLGSADESRYYERGIIRRLKENLRCGYDYIIIENSPGLYKEIYGLVGKTCKMIFHMHGSNYNKDEIREIGNTAYMIIAVSNFVKQYIENIVQCNIKVLYNCTAKNVFDYENKLVLREQGREEYKISEDKIVILFSGRVVYDKGVEKLFQAFEKVRKKRDDIFLIYAGSGGYGDSTQCSELQLELEKKKKIDDAILFTGYLIPENLSKVYALSDIIVIPSLIEEPFGVVVVEAMSMGLPMIVTKSGALPELVEKEFGIIVEKEDNLVENLASVLEYLIENPELRDEMGSASRQKFIKSKDFEDAYYFANFMTMLQ